MATMKKAQGGAKMVKATKIKQNLKDATQMKNMRPTGPTSGRVKPTMGDGKTIAKSGKSFPDLNKDGKITKADILKGRGVIAKSGTKMKKAGTTPKKMQYGGEVASMVPPMKMGGKMKKAGMHKMPGGAMMKDSAMKAGGKMKTCKGGC